MRNRLTMLVGFCFFAAPLAGIAGDWPQFRGLNNTGVADEKLPAEWGLETNVLWKVKIPGVAWSSPIVSGDRVFVTTAITENQRKPGGFAGFGDGPPGGPGGPGAGRFAPPQPGQIMPPFLQTMLNLSDEQKKQLEELQKEVDAKLVKLLSAEQQKQLQEPPGGRGGPGGRGPGGGGPGAFGQQSPPGQIVPPALQDSLKLTIEQKKQLDELQKNVDRRIATTFTEEQNEQLKEMRDRFGRGGGPGGFGGGPGGRGGFPGGPGGFGGGRPPDAVYRWELYCIDRKTGKTLWNQLVLESKPRIPTQPSNTYATETPVTDGERVYAYFGMHGLFCYDFSGNLVWKKDFGSYAMMAGWGTASSPVLDGDRLFVLCDNEEQSFLVALDKKTGDEIWRVSRTERTTWSSPVVWRNKVRTEVVTLGSPKMRSYDPATGKQLWELTVGNGQCSASPVGDAQMLYAGLRGMGGMGSGPGGPGPGGFGPGGDGRPDAEQRGGGAGAGRPGQAGGPMGSGGVGGLFAVKAGVSGDLSLKEGETSNAGVVWSSTRGGPEMASPLVYQGYVYILSQSGGIVTCFDAKTGKQVYRSRLPGAKGFWSSPWGCDGKIFCLDDSGTTYVLAAGADFKVLSQNKLDEMFWSSPAVANGAVFLRSVDHLYCIQE